jgi:putative spermidine/putrescine transport system permease protein
MATAQAITARPAPAKTERRDWTILLGYLLIAPPVLIMVFLILFPALQAIFDTLFLADPKTGAVSFSFAQYSAFFQNPVLRANLQFTVGVTVATVVLLFAVGFPLALFLRFTQGRVAAAVQILSLFPLFVPGVILAFAMRQYFITHGMLVTMLNAVGIPDFPSPYLQWQSIVIALVWENIPFTVLVLTAGLRQVEDAVVESARDVGANSLQIFARILLPLSLRSAVIVFCLNVIGVFGAFTLPYLLGGAQPMMMGVSMQQSFNNYGDRVGALTQAVITFAICAVIGLLYVRTVTRKQERA